MQKLFLFRKTFMLDISWVIRSRLVNGPGLIAISEQRYQVYLTRV